MDFHQSDTRSPLLIRRVAWLFFPMGALVLQRAGSRKQSHALTLKIGEQAGRREPR